MAQRNCGLVPGRTPFRLVSLGLLCSALLFDLSTTPLTWLGPYVSELTRLTGWLRRSHREAGRVGATEEPDARRLGPAAVALGRARPWAAGGGTLRWANLWWLSLSMLCSYGPRRSHFLSDALRLGTPTGPSISSIFRWSARLGRADARRAYQRRTRWGTFAASAGVRSKVQPGFGNAEWAGCARGLAAGAWALALHRILWAGNAHSIPARAVGCRCSWSTRSATWRSCFRWQCGCGNMAGAYARGDGSACSCSRPHLRRFIVTVLIEAFVGSSIHCVRPGPQRSERGCAAISWRRFCRRSIFPLHHREGNLPAGDHHYRRRRGLASS